MKEKAQLLDLELVDVKSNGSCVFSALAHQLGRKAEDAEIIRSEITAYMRRNEASMVIVSYIFCKWLTLWPAMCCAVFLWRCTNHHRHIPLMLCTYIILYYFRLMIMSQLMDSPIIFQNSVRFTVATKASSMACSLKLRHVDLLDGWTIEHW